MRFTIPRRGVTGFPGLLIEAVRAREVPGARARLEAEFCRRYGYRAAVATPSGRLGLEILLRALDLPVRRAYVPAYTIAAVPQIFRDAGFEVVFLDIDAATLSLTPEIVRETCCGPGVLLVTHYFGLAADMARIMAAARELSLVVIEDAAHSPGVKCGDRYVGSFGAGAFFSFETRKPLNGLGGGMAVASDPGVAVLMRGLLAGGDAGGPGPLRKLATTTAEWASLARPVFSALAPVLHRRAGDSNPLVATYRRFHAGNRAASFSDFQAWLVLRQLDTLERNTERKRQIAAFYDRGLPQEVTRPFDGPGRRHSYYCYVAGHPDSAAFGSFLRRNGVDCGIGAEVLQNCAPEARLPGVSRALETAVELPMFLGLQTEDATTICGIAGRWRRGER